MALTSGIEMDEMARRYAVPLARYFRARVRTAADIDDMVQEVFLRLAARRGGGTLETAENYLFTVA
ncbi:MAG: Sigma-70 region 2, partial [Phenylobacterium sp.]|nr:Sigma-70 region 2 [Phenylobacterium sp.]